MCQKELPDVAVHIFIACSKLNKDGVTIIMISHDISAAVRYATHILHIGAHVFFGTKEDYLASEASHVFGEGGEA